MSIVARHALTIGIAVFISGCGAFQQAQSEMQPPTAPLGAHRVLPASSYRVLYKFRRNRGTHPQAPLIDVGGTLYGTTDNGGDFRFGTVYAIGPSGAQTVLHSFSGGSDGLGPQAGLVDVDGTLYGTTDAGGAYNAGTVFSITPSGSEAVLYSFTGGADGGFPRAPLIVVNGTLYGTTTFGGDLKCKGSQPGCGTVFSIGTSGSEQVLHRFTKGSDGAFPVAGLLNVNGTLFGTTLLGGTERCYSSNLGCGTVYSISTSGNEKVLYSFKNSPDGSQPSSGLIEVKGKLYGTTFAGGSGGCGNSKYGCGVVYSVTKSGAEQVVYRFAAGAYDGGEPTGDLVALNGTLYGTAWDGGQACGSGSCGPGVIYSVSTTGSEKMLYAFSRSDGEKPDAGLTNVNGVLFGTTVFGGTGCPRDNNGGCGVIFTLSE